MRSVALPRPHTAWLDAGMAFPQKEGGVSVPLGTGGTGSKSAQVTAAVAIKGRAPFQSSRATPDLDEQGMKRLERPMRAIAPRQPAFDAPYGAFWPSGLVLSNPAAFGGAPDMCAAACHPGGEVTGAPGRNAAREILADLGRKFPAKRLL